MSVKGFKLSNGNVVRYDYYALDNLVENTGLSQEEKTLLLELLSKVAYIDNAETTYNQLSTLWAGYSIEWVGSGYSHSNSSSSIKSGSTFSSSITASSGFEIMNVLVTMGGNTVQGAWQNGTVTIPNVTGNIVITVTTSQATVSSISAVYTQSGNVYATDTLDSLKDDLVVTATYTDSTTYVVPSAEYTLSGTLAAGTSTITVTYGNKTTTFTVVVSASPITYLYNWDLTQSLVDSVSSKEIVLNAGSGVSNASRDSSGLHFNAGTQNAYLGTIEMVGKTIEIDVASFNFAGNTSKHIRFLMNSQYTTSSSKGLGALIYRSSTGWTSYGWAAASGATASWSANLWSSSLGVNAFNGKTVKVVYGSDGHTRTLYLDNNLVGTLTDVYFNNYGSTQLSDKIFIGGQNSVSASSGDQCYNMTITGIRIYANE